jgi:hypothetical protein
MALAAPRTELHELAGTAVNALVHHQHEGDAAPDTAFAGEAMDNIIAAVNGAAGGQVWVREQIARITGELGS